MPTEANLSPKAAARVARAAGITPYILGDAIEGEAREVAKVTLDEIISEWKAYLGTRNFTLLQQILDQLREITDPYAR